MKDLSSKLAITEMLPAKVYTETIGAVTIDLQGFESALVLLHIGIGGIQFTNTNKIEFILSHANDDEDSIKVTTKDVDTTVIDGIIYALKESHPLSEIKTLGYKGGKRYLTLEAKFSGTHGVGTPISAMVIKGSPHYKPE